MNLLLLEGEEAARPRLRLTGRRAAHLLRVLRVVKGDPLRAGVVDQGTGEAVVVATGPDWVEVEVGLRAPVEAEPPVDLLLAVPRPKVARRLLADLACLGVGTLHLTNAWRVERSYFASPVLTPEAIGHALRLGLEQAGAVRLPKVVIHHRLMAFVGDTLPTLHHDRRLVAHPAASLPLAAAAGRSLLALGPEGGWIERELETLRAAGFTPVSLGPRVLRSETAAIVAVAVATEFVGVASTGLGVRRSD
ncbi:MAG: 16S rRNA (uracil(1498)-N(3))-methyltransferase [Nitrospirae bacterium CG18_big_fil_WC_8_21_14_2_50_70_55]|nr:16S rRNA (uracil(1498)-N(3))-methyltransferase [Deltaproteobacteria bacterium]OIP67242.1 MAG: hypothetical protein AUK30_00840 [Nitrospirae bacterium CG2_30_70_394]PIQ03642.1 MAG: 16S rRNA (uracil(1498)-N(3))-methyltransferase [Nitrospirae bacterium CG18_big_fil_WC_8_21_14_2_50_70_55]PIW83248.1 MAG: 16S rRNA (uracil(1498)-N(3))-methyltransferase [Nitrospirae bacterium CG_4_8_14_3_um_filter_70_85]PIX82688.1 MAG: 16S rRNA (uracil(1498)-N(3))-methyltransferase [Nitrospirae bacterium CG_4_10_14_